MVLPSALEEAGPGTERGGDGRTTGAGPALTTEGRHIDRSGAGEGRGACALPGLLQGHNTAWRPAIVGRVMGILRWWQTRVRRELVSGGEASRQSGP
jgi:hypothetical protein